MHISFFNACELRVLGGIKLFHSLEIEVLACAVNRKGDRELGKDFKGV